MVQSAIPTEGVNPRGAELEIVDKYDAVLVRLRIDPEVSSSTVQIQFASQRMSVEVDVLRADLESPPST